MRSTLRRFLNDQSGATALEYGLIVAGISLAIVVAMAALSGNLRATFTTLANAMQTAGK